MILGGTTLGTLNNTALADWVPGPLPQGTPWGIRTAWNTNPYDTTKTPNTGLYTVLDVSVNDTNVSQA